MGMTSNIARRVWQHKQGLVEGFTKKYGVDRLVHCEAFARPQEAIQREKRLKKWNRAWKIQLIESTNPAWKDLYETVIDMPQSDVQVADCVLRRNGSGLRLARE
jgi:putative endonuclease